MLASDWRRECPAKWNQIHCASLRCTAVQELKKKKGLLALWSWSLTHDHKLAQTVAKEIYSVSEAKNKHDLL